MPETENNNPTGLSAMQEKMLNAGYAVTLPCGTLVHPQAKSQANNAQPKANKPAAKTAPAKAKREVPAEIRRTWANKKAFKAMKGNTLPATLHGKTTYTQQEAIDAGLLTPITRKPTAEAQRLMAGDTNKQTVHVEEPAVDELTLNELQEMDRLMQKYNVTIA